MAEYFDVDKKLAHISATLDPIELEEINRQATEAARSFWPATDIPHRPLHQFEHSVFHYRGYQPIYVAYLLIKACGVEEASRALGEGSIFELFGGWAAQYREEAREACRLACIEQRTPATEPLYVQAAWSAYRKLHNRFGSFEASYAVIEAAGGMADGDERFSRAREDSPARGKMRIERVREECRNAGVLPPRRGEIESLGLAFIAPFNALVRSLVFSPVVAGYFK